MEVRRKKSCMSFINQARTIERFMDLRGKTAFLCEECDDYCCEECATECDSCSGFVCYRFCYDCKCDVKFCGEHTCGRYCPGCYYLGGTRRVIVNNVMTAGITSLRHVNMIGMITIKSVNNYRGLRGWELVVQSR